MSATTNEGRPVWMSRRLYGLLMTHGGRVLLVCAALVLLLGIGLGAFLLGRRSAADDLATANTLNQQLQTEGQKLKRDMAGQSAQITTQQAKLKTVQAALDSILPSQNTYNIVPNQSLIVADGHLTVALIGSPSNEGITISVNGKQQTAAAGDVIKVAVDPSTTCQVGVQSFDVFKAILNASCSDTKPK